MGCPSGTEQNVALCYPLCNAGYYGDGPVCWENCPSGERAGAPWPSRCLLTFAQCRARLFATLARLAAIQTTHR